jgi:Cysteine dioxygenase type I
MTAVVLPADASFGPAPVDARLPLPAGVLADIAAGLAEARTLWQAVVRYEADGRQPVRLLVTERYEAWVIGWLDGQGVRMHDHGASAGTIVVTAGELTELVPPDALPSGAAGAQPAEKADVSFPRPPSEVVGAGDSVERRLTAGRVWPVPVGAVHDVVNRSPEPATSIHVYSPPLTQMTYYDPATLRPVETMQLGHAPPVLGPRAPSFLLHPSNRASHA